MIGVYLLSQKNKEALPELERQRIDVRQLKHTVQKLDERGAPVHLRLLLLRAPLPTPLQKLPLNQLTEAADGPALWKQQHLRQGHQLSSSDLAVCQHCHMHRVADHLAHQNGCLLQDEAYLLIPFGGVELHHPLEGVVAVG